MNKLSYIEWKKSFSSVELKYFPYGIDYISLSTELSRILLPTNQKLMENLYML